MSSDEDLVHVMVSSSLLITIFPFIYLNHAYSLLTDEEKQQSVVSFTTLAIVLPVMAGILFLVSYYALAFIPRKYNGTYVRFIVSGTVMSLFLSLIGHYVLHIHDKWLHLDNPNTVHFLVPVFYFVVYATIGSWLRARILYGFNPVMPTTMVQQPQMTKMSTPGKPPLNPNKLQAYNQMAKIANKSI